MTGADPIFRAAFAAPAHRRPRLAVSSCLLGEEVRYDGRHMRHDWLVETLGPCVDFTPLCPEVAIGLGVPREPVQLTGDREHPRVRGVIHPDLDVTEPLQAEGRRVAAALDAGGTAGYVFKSRSPSCGLSRVSIRTGTGSVLRSGRGVFACTIREAQPCLPVEDEYGLHDPVRRENFLIRLYAYQRWLSLCASGVTLPRLRDFHARHEYLLMAHSVPACQRLRRLLPPAPDIAPGALAGRYLAEFMPALTRHSGAAGHYRVLRGMVRDLRGDMDRDGIAGLLDMPEAYRRGEIPRAAPVTVLREHFRRCPDRCIAMQWYLWPYPDALGSDAAA